MRVFAILTLIAVSVVMALGTTLQQLSLGDMTRQSTAIVRAKVRDSHAVLRNGNVYTVYRLETLETLKSGGSRSAIPEVAIPGGIAGGIRQAVEGAPVLQPGVEYVLFLWTGRTGLTQIMGLSQGLFRLLPGPSGEDSVVQRAASGERMLDAAGHPVRDSELVMRWSQLKAQVGQALNGPLAAASARAEGR